MSFQKFISVAFQLLLLVGAILALGYIFIWNKDESCVGEEVKSHLEAFNLMKKEILSNHMSRLVQEGIDKSLFDEVQLDNKPYDHCGSPPRFSSYRQTKTNNTFLKLSGFYKGDCEKCWELGVVQAEVTNCGVVRSVQINRLPAWKDPKKSDGTLKQRGDGGEICGPAYWP